MSHIETQQGISTGAIITILVIFLVLLLGVFSLPICVICTVFCEHCTKRFNRHINKQSADYLQQRYSISTYRHGRRMKISDTDETESHTSTRSTTVTDISDIPRPGLYETDHHEQRLDDTEYHEPTILEHDNREKDKTTLQDVNNPVPSTAGPTVHQEMPDWFKEMCNNTDIDLEDALQKEDSLTYSHETQILLPTSGPPIDPDNAPTHQENQDTDLNCQTPPQEHHENLSLTPAAIPGPIVDQDRTDWFTDIYRMTDIDMEDALQKEDSLITYSRETQILLPTSGPPIDPDNLGLNALEHQENQDTDHYCQSLTQEHVIHENLSFNTCCHA